MIKVKGSTKGTILIEASIVIPLFMITVMFIYGLFSVNGAQSQMTHALIQSSKSLSLDSYLTEHVESLSETETFWFSFGHMVLELGRMNTNKNFTSSNSWYKGKGDDALARSRFIGYLAGGNEELADEKLKNLGIVDGLDGVKFTMAIDGEDMTINLKYTIQFWFDAFDLGKIPVEQSITSKLWI